MYFLRIIFVVLLSGLLLSCGGGSGGGDGNYLDQSNFNTVRAYAVSVQQLVESDAATHQNLYPEASNYCDSVTYSTDTADFNLYTVSKDYILAGVSPSSVYVNSARVSYDPLDSSYPDIPDKNVPVNVLIDADGEVTVTLAVLDTAQKTAYPVNQLLDSDVMYSYAVRVDFNGIEVDTEDEKSFSASLTLNVSDYRSEEEDCVVNPSSNVPDEDPANLETVYLSVNSPYTVFDSDVALRYDSDGDSLCDGAYVVADDIITSVSSHIKESGSPSKVEITHIYVKYVPLYTDTPVLMDQDYPVSYYVDPEFSTEVPVRLVTHEMKTLDFAGIVGTSTVYTYDVFITMKAIELSTGVEGELSFDLTLKALDYVSEGEDCY